MLYVLLSMLYSMETMFYFTPGDIFCKDYIRDRFVFVT